MHQLHIALECHTSGTKFTKNFHVHKYIPQIILHITNHSRPAFLHLP